MACAGIPRALVALRECLDRLIEHIADMQACRHVARSRACIFRARAVGSLQTKFSSRIGVICHRARTPRAGSRCGRLTRAVRAPTAHAARLHCAMGRRQKAGHDLHSGGRFPRPVGAKKRVLHHESRNTTVVEAVMATKLFVRLIQELLSRLVHPPSHSRPGCDMSGLDQIGEAKLRAYPG